MARIASVARSCYPKPVAVWIFKVAFPPGETLFIDGYPELLRDRVDVVDVQVNKGVGPCVSLVLREIEPNASACHRNEQWKARLELMFPLPLETEPLVPGDSPSGDLDIQDRDDLFVQASELIGATRDKRRCLGQRAGMSSEQALLRRKRESVQPGGGKAWRASVRVPCIRHEAFLARSDRCAAPDSGSRLGQCAGMSPGRNRRGS